MLNGVTTPTMMEKVKTTVDPDLVIFDWLIFLRVNRPLAVFRKRCIHNRIYTAKTHMHPSGDLQEPGILKK